MTHSSRSNNGNPPLPTRKKPPRPGSATTVQKPVKEDDLDRAIENTFPASDPVSVDTRVPRGEP